MKDSNTTTTNPTNIELREQIFKAVMTAWNCSKTPEVVTDEILALLPTSKNYPHDYIRKNQDERKA